MVETDTLRLPGFYLRTDPRTSISSFSTRPLDAPCRWNPLWLDHVQQLHCINDQKMAKIVQKSGPFVITLAVVALWAHFSQFTHKYHAYLDF